MSKHFLTERDVAAVLARLKKPLSKKTKERALTAGGYPYDDRLDNDAYERQLRPLQVELVKLQRHVRAAGLRVVALFEGRDAAGKGGVIKRFTAYLNPRYAHVVALPKPTEAQAGQWYFQRYVACLPTAGDMSFFDRSWYNRAGVERVFGFCSERDVARFLDEATVFERMIQRDGVILFKYWLTIGRETQFERFHQRATDPLKTWKLSPIDLAALDLWDEYTAAKCAMMRATHTPDTPWTVIRANDKRRARLNAMRHFLSAFTYPEKDKRAIGTVDPNIVVSGDAEMEPDDKEGAARASAS